MLYLVVFEAGMNLVFLAGEVDNNHNDGKRVALKYNQHLKRQRILQVKFKIISICKNHPEETVWFYLQ